MKDYITKRLNELLSNGNFLKEAEGAACRLLNQPLADSDRQNTIGSIECASYYLDKEHTPLDDFVTVTEYFRVIRDYIKEVKSMTINDHSLNYLRKLLDEANEKNLKDGTTYEEFWLYLTSVFCDSGKCINPVCDKCLLQLTKNVLGNLNHSSMKLRFYKTFIDLLQEKYYAPDSGSEYRFEEEKEPNISKKEAMFDCDDDGDFMCFESLEEEEGGDY